ncbi:MAG: DUF1874 domain-containing protein [Methanobacteriaceae archaeon]|nr:DUF1874 domain-containing protein [Methanobacteriaceae archaeon]
MIFLVSSFSLQMVHEYPASLRVEEVSREEFKNGLKHGFYPAVGHKPTATLLSSLLGLCVPFRRVSVALSEGDQLFVAQYVGGRLPEGVTVLPEGSEFKYLRVEL